MKYQCPCCGYFTYEEEPSGSGYICPVCFWEDDKLQQKDPTFAGGANRVSLEQARINFKSFGACEKDFVAKVREPRPEEIDLDKSFTEDDYESNDSAFD